MDYVPHTLEDQKAMLAAIGVKKIQDLFADIAKDIQLNKPMTLPPGLTEMETRGVVESLGKQNTVFSANKNFMGAGAYAHFIPAAVWRLALRSEFHTSYTPYQPEISQGMLQAIFEWQTLICQLTGMDVTNASMYDGASSLGEAVHLAAKITRRNKVLLANSNHFNYKAVVEATCRHVGLQVETLPYTRAGTLDANALTKALDENTAIVVVQNPNALGLIEDLTALAETVHEKGAWLGVSIGDATSLGLLKPPGACGADVVTGDAQSFGVPVSYGGPYAGFFAFTKRDVRMLPGRLVGQTQDARGDRGYIMTLQTREQHIRRAKATSNICTNQALFALASTIHLSMLGKQGISELATRNAENAYAARELLLEIKDVESVFDGPIYNEFVLRVPHAQNVHAALVKKGFLAGLPLEPHEPALKDTLLFNVTEQHEKEHIDALASALEEAMQ